MMNSAPPLEAYLHSPARATGLQSLATHTNTAAGAARALYLMLSEFSLDDPRDRFAAQTLASTVADHATAADLLVERMPVSVDVGIRTDAAPSSSSPPPIGPSPRSIDDEEIEDLWRLAGAVDLAARGLKALTEGSSLDPEDVEPLVELTSRLSSRLISLRDAT